MTVINAREFLGIFVDKCPCYSEALPACPLSGIRSIPDADERRRKLAAMCDDEVQELFRQHVLCISKVCGT